MDTGILLENGTNELEVLEFTINDRCYGINVAKVNEIITYQPVTPIPNSHPSIEGIFMPRDRMLTAVDLKSCLQLGTSEPGGLFILTNFNALDMAFHVDSVRRISRVSWSDIMKPTETLGSQEDGLATGIIKKNNELIIILDFEKIVTEINPDTGLKIHDVDSLAGRSRIDVPILVAEDSVLLNKMIVQSLETAGYTNLTHTENGQEAWDLIEKWRDEGTLSRHVQCLITDIEMPKMDGHRLTRLIKEDARTKDIIVVIFSSMINDDMKRKGEQLGADAQLTKPEIGLLVGAVDKLLGVG
ncbi:MAG TPA: chemotaxis protein CheV [Lachnospiraceae bacterium]|nr:chemotaxis protein CheV [Lachnospiraceae bacterium]